MSSRQKSAESGAQQGLAGTRAIILAAGVGARLSNNNGTPKSLLRFDDRSLLARHLDRLREQGVGSISIAVGYKADMIEAEVARHAAGIDVRLIENPYFREGSMVSLWTMRDELRWGGDVVLMDADVLYDRRMLDHLGGGEMPDAILSDGAFVPGDEPVKLCRRAGRIVDFRKVVETSFDSCGESVGFFRFQAPTAAALAGIVEAYVDAGRRDKAYEEAIRDLLLGPHGDQFAVVDVTGVPWIEIDFPEDIDRARTEILPRLIG